VALEDSPSLRRFIPSMLTDQTARAHRDLAHILTLYGKQSRIDIDKQPCYGIAVQVPSIQ
jgi:hypothetical protein